MAFTKSAIFNSWVYDALYPTTSFAGKLSNTTFQCALFNNTITPDNTAVSASCKYNGGVWTTGNEVIDTLNTNWVAKGRPIGTPSSPPATYSALGYVMFDAADTAGAGNLTLASVYGDLVFDDVLTTPVADQALAYHYYGGVQGVTNGTFTVTWHSNGIARWTHAEA